MREAIRSTINRSHAQRPQARFKSRNLVNASLSILGRTFRTNIREGATAEDLIERVAKENGGGVAKVYYPEFKTWEIVAVKIGDRLLVKGDSKRVAEADFSQFLDGASVRAAAIAASKSSEGGIHFSLGESGIPMAATQDQGVVFPNAEELRIGKDTSDIALWNTSAAFDPQTISDIDNMYDGRSHLTKDAMEKVAAAHGGDRQDKLLLHDNILVLNKDTGEIKTVKETGSGDVSFMNAPMPPPLTFEPQTATPTIEHHDMPAFDGRPERVSYMMVKTFDGAFTEHVQMGFQPISMDSEDAIQKPEPVVTEPEFSMLVFDAPEIKVSETKPPKGQKAPKTKNPKKMPTPRKQKAPKPKMPSFASALASWSMPRTEHICLDTPKAVMPLKRIKKPELKAEPVKTTTVKSKKNLAPKPKTTKKKPRKLKIKKKQKKKPVLKSKRKAKPKSKTKRRKPTIKRKPIKKRIAKKKPAPETISKKPRKKPKAKPKIKTRAKAKPVKKVRNLLKKTKKSRKVLSKKKSHYLKELKGHPSSKRSTGKASARNSR